MLTVFTKFSVEFKCELFKTSIQLDGIVQHLKIYGKILCVGDTLYIHSRDVTVYFNASVCKFLSHLSRNIVYNH